MDELAKRFADAAAQYAPQVADAARAAMQIEAYSNLTFSLLWFLMAFASFRFGLFLCNHEYDVDNFSDLPSFSKVVGALLIGLATVFILPGVWNWINPWTWMMINHPDIALARHAFRI